MVDIHRGKLWETLSGTGGKCQKTAENPDFYQEKAA